MITYVACTHLGGALANCARIDLYFVVSRFWRHVSSGNIAWQSQSSLNEMWRSAPEQRPPAWQSQHLRNLVVLTLPSESNCRFPELGAFALLDQVASKWRLIPITRGALPSERCKDRSTVRELEMTTRPAGGWWCPSSDPSGGVRKTGRADAHTRGGASSRRTRWPLPAPQCSLFGRQNAFGLHALLLASKQALSINTRHRMSVTMVRTGAAHSQFLALVPAR